MPAKPRRERGSGAVYKTSSGQWRATIDLGTINGVRRRKTISSRKREVVVKRLRELQRQVEDHGDLPTATPTVKAWLNYWLDHIATKRLKPRTLDTYRGYVSTWLIPHLGNKRLDQLQPQHVRALHEAITDAGRSTTTALQAHRILARALTDAVNEGKVGRNVATMLDAPRKAVNSRGALTSDEAVALLTTTDETVMGVRWMHALFTGARQGESLGLEWDRVDLKAGTVDTSWQLQRLKFRHGCGGLCGLKRAGSCPDRELAVPLGFEWRDLGAGGLVLTRPKSKAGWRIVPMAEPLWAGMRWLHERQGRPKRGLVWTRDDGRPIDPSDDTPAWHAALAVAGLPDVPLHAARHTTATLLGRLGVPPHVVASILGHSSIAVTQGYQHADLTLQREAMDRLGQLLAIERQAHTSEGN